MIKLLELLLEKSKSKSQQRLFGMALAYKRGDLPNASEKIKKIANSMSMEELEKFASTKHKGLPDRKDEDYDYRGEHSAPDKESGAPLYDVTLNGIYPDDFYSSDGARYYGDGYSSDFTVWNKIVYYHNRPSRRIRVFRSVPKGVKGINPGDWVTIYRPYADTHGKQIYGDRRKFTVISKVCRADEIFTNGDSFYEWGYDPS
jgi:hypothetical protein